MKILLTGSDGFIGSNLKNTDYHFHCLDIKSGKDLMTCELPDVDVVIHLAGLSGVRESLDYPTDYWINNVIVSQRIFERYKDKRILYASSSTAYEPWKNPYAMSKYSMEQIAPENSVGMRFTTVYGPGAKKDMLIPRILRNDVPFINVNHKRDFIHVDDVISAMLILLHNEYKGIIDIGTGISNKLTDILERVGIETKGAIGNDTERFDNKADTTLLNSYSWKSSIDLFDYILQNKVVN
tara:strand:+ start:13481 stop:14197 length:717 start_codon:yes stop_codon:yes gene_type:complete